jgi:hypothetical protein
MGALDHDMLGNYLKISNPEVLGNYSRIETASVSRDVVAQVEYLLHCEV